MQAAASLLHWQGRAAWMQVWVWKVTAPPGPVTLRLRLDTLTETGDQTWRQSLLTRARTPPPRARAEEKNIRERERLEREEEKRRKSRCRSEKQAKWLNIREFSCGLGLTSGGFYCPAYTDGTCRHVFRRVRLCFSSASHQQMWGDESDAGSGVEWRGGEGRGRESKFSTKRFSTNRNNKEARKEQYQTSLRRCLIDTCVWINVRMELFHI